MSVALVKTSRSMKGWRVPLLAGGVWLALVLAAELLGRLSGRQANLCFFRRFTGIECPSCGLTRGVRLMLTGRILQGWAMNPLFFTVIAAFLAVLALRLILGRSVQVEPGKAGKVAACIIAIVLFGLNWLYVILRP